MDTKSIITYNGAGPLFRSLESHISGAIPQEACEWRRTYGRVIKNVQLDAIFQPFSTAPLEKYEKGEWSIQQHPILHIFVTECSDIDTYKITVKEEIDTWLKTLNSFGVHDWMILLVETLDVKKTKNLLPRTTVLDKIRLDFGSKHGDRCISVLNPAKFEHKSTDSFRCLIQRIRHLMLTSYTRNISKYEELIRANREKRNLEGWNFTKYFLLQEDLALMLERLEIHSDALIQYDELDAMFSQFIMNSSFGEKYKWLECFRKPLTCFHGISLKKHDKFSNRDKIVNETATLLEFRNYLFERQAHLLQLCEKSAEIAARLIPFLFSTLREIDLLKVDSPIGALACWEFVCSIEVLSACDQAMETNQVSCFQHCAPIWNLAKDKLFELGKICGLLPGLTPNSEQLHIVVQLSAGIGDAPLEEKFLDPLPQIENKSRSLKKPKKSSTEQLKEALGSHSAFQKLYLELSELAISTYKHISRLRSARLVGLDLGNFYCSLNEPHKAVVFFTDLLRELKLENWSCLASQTLLELANCYRKMNDQLAYTKACSAISCCSDLEILVRTFYFDEFLKGLKSLKNVLPAEDTNSSNLSVLEDHFKILEIVILNEKPIIQDDIIIVRFKLESYFPREIIGDSISLSFNLQTMPQDENQSSAVAKTTQVTSNARLDVSLHLDYKQDDTLSCASVACNSTRSRQPVRRTSSTRRKLSPAARHDFTNHVSANSVPLQPGVNIVQLQTKAVRVGIWNFEQLSIQVSPIEFLSDQIPLKLNSFEITTIPPSATLNSNELVAGIEQPVELAVSGGSFIFAPDAKIVLKCSRNLRVRLLNDGSNEENPMSQFKQQLNIPLMNFKSFENRTIPLEVLADLPGRNVEQKIEHVITLSSPWSRNEQINPLKFMPALTASCRLHTCGTQKFLQVCLKGLDAYLVLKDAQMKCDAKGVSIIDLNPSTQKEMVIYKNLTLSYLWELQVEPLKTENELPVIKVTFSMQYANFFNPSITRSYACAFDVMDYTTLFKIQARLEPSELCRVGSVCNLNLKIVKLQENPFIDLMYEVVTDQKLWAVCGRTAGVISMKDVESHSIALDVLPLTTGFLPMPNIRLSKYISAGKLKQDVQPKLHPFPQGQIYNSTKSMQIRVLANSGNE